MPLIYFTLASAAGTPPTLIRCAEGALAVGGLYGRAREILRAMGADRDDDVAFFGLDAHDPHLGPALEGAYDGDVTLLRDFWLFEWDGTDYRVVRQPLDLQEGSASVRTDATTNSDLPPVWCVTGRGGRTRTRPC